MERPILKNKIIHTQMGEDQIFENAMDKFIKDLDNYSIQFKPANGRLIALITYEEVVVEEEEVVHPNTAPTGV